MVSNLKSLLVEMGFCSTVVQRAIDANGKDTPIDEMVNFIVAAQYAEEEDVVVPVVAMEPEVPHKLLLEEMDKTRRLLEMGFSDHEISMAIAKIGTQAQISDIAESIITGLLPEKKVSAAPAANRACPSKGWRFIGDGCSSSGTANVVETSKVKRLKDEDKKAYPDFDDRGKKRQRLGYMGGSSSSPRMQDDESKENAYEFPPRLSQVLSPYVAKRPYFFYGNMAELSPTWWSRISKFLFDIHPEHVDTRLFSALHRKEGYVHNLPIENRFNILPKPRLAMREGTTPDQLECIMGYPANHTSGVRLAERLKLLDYCFQTDTLGYHLSVLKAMFPKGLRLVSLFSGVGGAEIALSRLGIHLKCVVSVEHCGLSRNILKRWWQTSRQTGELVQIEDINSVSTRKLETLLQRFGGFDVIVCQNPPTPPDLSVESSGSKASRFNFMLFNECVRIIKRVRDAMELSWPSAAPWRKFWEQSRMFVILFVSFISFLLSCSRVFL